MNTCSVTDATTVAFGDQVAVQCNGVRENGSNYAHNTCSVLLRYTG